MDNDNTMDRRKHTCEVREEGDVTKERMRCVLEVRDGVVEVAYLAHVRTKGRLQSSPLQAVLGVAMATLSGVETFALLTLGCRSPTREALHVEAHERASDVDHARDRLERRVYERAWN